MVRLNRTKLSTTQSEALFTQLNKSLGKLTEKQAGDFLTELLGAEERVMLAKRLATIVLLCEGKSLYRIAHILKISPSTAERIKERLDAGAYDHIIAPLGKNKKEYFSVLETLDSILHLGGILPHYNGLDRYRGL